MKERIDLLLREIRHEHTRALYDCMSENTDLIKLISNVFIDAFEHDKKLLLFGNGGSAADAQHVAAEFINRFETERKPLPAIALTTDSSNITAIANDYDFTDIFGKQIYALGQREDVAIGISTSGNSNNVMYGLEVAHTRGLKTILFSGQKKASKRYRKFIHYTVKVPSINTARIQEVQIVIWHMICSLVDEYYKNKG